MRVAVAGKGGVGKTTIAAVLARLLARRGRPVVAIDCDSDPHLAIGIGLGVGADDAMVPLLERGGAQAPAGTDASPVQLLTRHGTEGPDGVTVLLAARIARAGAG